MIEIKDFEQLSNGCYKYKWRPMNSDLKYKHSVFFPKEWTKRQVMTKVTEAINNLVKFPEPMDNGEWRLIGVTKKGMRIESFVRAAGNNARVTSFYGGILE